MTRKPQTSPLQPPLAITMAASEIVPFAKTGGLADVVGALSRALASAGVRVNMVIPAFRPILRNVINHRKPLRALDIDISGRKVAGSVIRKKISPNLDVFFIRADEYFDHDCLYGDVSGDYPDNAERFAFFSRAVLEVAGMTGSRVIHVHDWQAAPAAAFLRLQPERYPQLAGIKTILTIHNLAYQGLFDRDHWPALSLDPCHFNPCQFEFWDRINYLKSGLVNADRIITVSPTYACEIQQNGCGFGLEGVLKERSNDLTGILNGVDYGIWNPETDSYIQQRYSRDDLAGKHACKLALQGSYGLDRDPDAPLLCMVTRLADSKGLELVKETIECLLAEGVQLAVLGRGDRCYEDFFCSLASRFPGRVGVKIAFDEALAHQTIAGADILIMPSRQEPCGLTQMYSLRYGTVPVVRRTGGLADSIEPHNAAAGSGDGFLFDEYSGLALIDGIHRALSVYYDKTEWQTLIRRGMFADHSWERSMQVYLNLYQGLSPDLK